MRPLNSADVLWLWETGRRLHPLDKALLALRTAFPEVQENVADWPLGQRNRALAHLRGQLVGPQLHGWTRCRQCPEQLEFRLDGDTLARSAVAAADERVVVGELTYRLPTSRDLTTVASEQDPLSAARRLLRQCCINGSPATTQWNEEEINLIGERMAAADPLAEILLQFDCPSCGASFEESLDLVSFLWTELEVRARGLLRSVHRLAAAYGWSEGDILSLTPARRQAYLDMVGE